jgi:PAS domain S-box-containing protein
MIELRKMLGNVPLLLLLISREDNTYYLKRVEGQLASRLKLSNETLQGRPYQETIAYLIEDDRLMQAFAGEPQTYELAIEDQPYEMQLQPFDEFGEVNEVTGLMRPISQRKQHEQQQALLERTVELVHEAVLVYDAEMTIRYANPYFQELLGYEAAELVDQPLAQLLPEQQRMSGLRFLQPQHPAPPAEPREGELDHLHKDGTRIPMEVVTAPVFGQDGHFLGQVYIARNLDLHHALLNRKHRAEHRNRLMTTNLYAYAKTIQEEFSPELESLHQTLPESFVVQHSQRKLSHNLLWLTQHFNNAFIALVETGGEGFVATLRGFTVFSLLNQIVNTRMILEPNRILNELEEGTRPFIELNERLDLEEEEEEYNALAISFLSYNYEKRQVKFAAAQQTMLVIRAEGVSLYEGHDREIGAPEGQGTMPEEGEDRLYNPVSLDLRPGEVVVVFSRSLLDLRHPESGEALSLGHLQAFFENNTELPFEELKAATGDFLKAWHQGASPPADFLLLAFRVP